MEEVLQNINRLNRNLEGIIAVSTTYILVVYFSYLLHETSIMLLQDLLNTERRDILISYLKVGNEFSSVEALWSQFENFMGRDGEEGAGEGHAEGEAQDDHDQHEDSRVEESGRGSATDIKDER